MKLSKSSQGSKTPQITKYLGSASSLTEFGGQDLTSAEHKQTELSPSHEVFVKNISETDAVQNKYLYPNNYAAVSEDFGCRTIMLASKGSVDVVTQTCASSLTTNSDRLIDLEVPETGVLIDFDTASDIGGDSEKKFKQSQTPPSYQSCGINATGESLHVNDLTPVSEFANRIDARKALCDNHTPRNKSAEALRRLEMKPSRLESHVVRHSHPPSTAPLMPIIRKGKPEASQESRRPIRPIHFVPNEDFVDPIFSNETARRNVIRMNLDQNGHVPLMLQYGIQYMPNIRTAIAEPGHEHIGFQCRSVIISDLPAVANLRDVMARVRGGNIVRATLVDTISLGTGRTAFVVFSKWLEADAYAVYAQENPGHIDILGKQATVALAGKPTYPRRQLQQPGQDQTRCLEFRWIPKHICNGLLRNIEHLFHHAEDALEDMWYDQTGSAIMLFKNIDYAIRFHEFICNSDAYIDRSHNLEYIEDPCSGPLERLAAPASLARGNYASLIEKCVAWECSNGHKELSARLGDMQSSPPIAPTAHTMAHCLQPISDDQAVSASILKEQHASVNETCVSASETTETEDDGANGIRNAEATRLQAVRPIVAVAASNKSYSEDIFMPQGEKWTGFKIYTIEESKKRYDLEFYRENPVKWRAAWPYVGDMKMFKPTEIDDEWVPKAQLPRDSSVIQTLIERDTHSHVRKSDIIQAQSEAKSVAVPPSDL
ncbi:hypothetical protein TruAng_010289 [Truncatella angustata]|nr:hypothetical protein TruAng_010289 [Truncatella angustata]